MSAQTLEFHWGKHYSGYVDKLNGLIVGTEHEGQTTIEQIMLSSSCAIYNNSAQAWIHEFFFEQLSSTPKSQPQGALHEALVRDFGSVEKFITEFKGAASTLFGSGWVWLVADDRSNLSIATTQNAINPLSEMGLRPIMVLDVWEHAYYLDYQNRRPDFIDNFEKILDWNIIERRF